MACSLVSPLGLVGRWKDGGDVNDSESDDESDEISMKFGLGFMVAADYLGDELGIYNLIGVNWGFLLLFIGQVKLVFRKVNARRFRSNY